MAGWAQTFFFFCSTVSAAVIPHVGSSRDQHDTTVVDVADAGNQYSLRYLVPCDHCSSDPENKTAQIDLVVLSANNECGTASTLVLNGSPLQYTTWHRTIKQRINFKANSTESAAPPVDVEADLQLGCLNGDTSIMALNIVSLNKLQTPAGSGFTLSFKQKQGAEGINYTTVPLRNVDDLDIDLKWGDPDSMGGLVREFQNLQIIEMAIDQLHDRHLEQQQRIKSIVIQEFKSCNSISCYLQKAKESAPYMSSLLRTLFCQKYKYSSGAASSGQIPLSSVKSTTQHTYQDIPSHVDDYTQKQHDQDPSSASPYHSTGKTFGITSQQFSYRQPSFIRRHRLPFILSVFGLVLLLSLAFVIFKAVKGKLSCCINPRVRREFAARREERRTRAAYRRAACRQRVKRWFTSFRKPAPTSDYDEKRARILSQEGILEHVMQNEITSLQRAHEIVTDMVRAEEGRQRIHHEVNFGVQNLPTYLYQRGSSIAIRNNGEGSSAGSIQTLPLYSSPPPSYESDLGGDMTVVDGFIYTPSASDNTSESSVVDCTSHLSFDTDSE